MSTTVALPPEHLQRRCADSRQRSASRWRLLVRTPGRWRRCHNRDLHADGDHRPVPVPGEPAHRSEQHLRAPSLAHPLGTDFEGADILALLVTGARYVLFAAAIAAVITLVIGTVAGLAAGYYPKRDGSVIMRVTDFVLAIPGLPVLIVLSTIWHFGSLSQMGVALGVFGWGGIARAVRAQTMSLRERGFVEAARGLGLPGRHIIRARCCRTWRPSSG